MQVVMLKPGDLPVSGCRGSRVTDRTRGGYSLFFGALPFFFDSGGLFLLPAEIVTVSHNGKGSGILMAWT